MRWLYLFYVTVGVVTIVPTVLRAIDLQERNRTTGVIGFGALTAGLTGFLLAEFAGPVATVVASIALGLAAAAIHPEILNTFSTPPEQDQSIDDNSSSTDEETNLETAASTQPLNSKDAESDA